MGELIDLYDYLERLVERQREARLAEHRRQDEPIVRQLLSWGLTPAQIASQGPAFSQVEIEAMAREPSD